jgi:hypothetical protein
MEQEEITEKSIKNYAEWLDDIIDVLISVEPQNADVMDKSILRAIREANELKCYFKNQL